mgnify:FL=1
MAGIELEDAVTHQFPRASPETYRVNANRELKFRPQVQGAGTVRYDRAMRELDTLELARIVRGDAPPGEPLALDDDPEKQEEALRLAFEAGK